MIQMTLETAASMEAGKPTTLQFKPIHKNSAASIVELEAVHTQKLHLIVVSEDLSFFSHQHPQWNGDSYQLDFTFPTAGNYLLYADYKPVDHAPIVEQLQVQVTGAAASNTRYSSEQLTASQDDITVQLVIDNLAAIKALVYQNQAPLPATAIDDFLGAKAHVVMIHTEDKDFLHVHPMVHGDELVLHANFTKRGTYRVWVQFLLQGKVYTTDFVLPVAALPHARPMMHHHH